MYINILHNLSSVIIISNSGTKNTVISVRYDPNNKDLSMPIIELTYKRRIWVFTVEMKNRL
uniref:Cytochrome b6-f complex subunit n=1 Tax=Kumanoa americana TaxID=1196377 RepID=A0A1C9CGD0_9FLOR|nr:cytochrome b6-f complex subunit [Kumanoa americana]AOM67443.1 cytochrome b6-f complex subunit [Kumanoa americana]